MTNVSQKIPNTIGVLIPFTRGYSQKLHASGIAKQLKLPQKTVARKLDYLQKRRLLEFKRVGKNKYYFFDWNKISSMSLLMIVENYKELRFFIEYSRLSLLLNELSLKNSVILFGSYAKNSAKESSDVDIVIIGKENKTLELIIKRYPFETNPYFFTFSYFKKMLKKEEPLAKEIAKDHILFGEKEKVIKIFKEYFTR